MPSIQEIRDAHESSMHGLEFSTACLLEAFDWNEDELEEHRAGPPVADGERWQLSWSYRSDDDPGDWTIERYAAEQGVWYLGLGCEITEVDALALISGGGELKTRTLAAIEIILGDGLGRTVAEAIAYHYGDDGQRCEDDYGTRIEDICLDLGQDDTRLERPDISRHEFSDGSALVLAGCTWDVEGDEPFSPAGR